MASGAPRLNPERTRDGVEACDIGGRAAVDLVVSGVIEVGTAAPFVSPLFEALHRIKDKLDTARENKEQLTELLARCTLVTELVIAKCDGLESKIDLIPLKECIEGCETLADRYNNRRGKLSKILRSKDDSREFQALHDRLGAYVSYMNLGSGVICSQQLEHIRQQLVALTSASTLAPAPRGVPLAKPWHVVRKGVLDGVFGRLSRGGGAKLAALVGSPGSGKSTAAAAIFSQHGSRDRGQRYFRDGIVWLSVGQGSGAPRRLNDLMLKLAGMVYNDVLKKRVDKRKDSEDATCYIKRVVSDEGLVQLLIADDVWEPEVVDKLRMTGMSVLLTTRDASLVTAQEKVDVDELLDEEAEEILRLAAEIPPGAHLPAEASAVIDRCKHAAMDVAFVGRWDCVRTSDDGEPQDGSAWAEAVQTIDAELARSGEQCDLDTSDGRRARRFAIMRAGFENLGHEHPKALKLFVKLAVLPDEYAFQVEEVAVLLIGRNSADRQVKNTREAVRTLERWSLLASRDCNTYSMHASHADFARSKLVDQVSVCEEAVGSWAKLLSGLEVVRNIDRFTLGDLWRALERVNEKSGWRITRPYDSQLDMSNPDSFGDAEAIAAFYTAEGDDRGAEAIMQKVLEHSNDTLEVLRALWFCIRGAKDRGCDADKERWLRRLTSVLDAMPSEWRPDEDRDKDKATTSSYVIGLCFEMAERHEEAERWFSRAWSARQALDTGRDHPFDAGIPYRLGVQARASGRPAEAEELLHRSLRIREAKLGPDHENVGYTLYELGLCLVDQQRPVEAEKCLRNALRIREAKLEEGQPFEHGLRTRNLDVGYTLFFLGWCSVTLKRPAEAEAHFRRALRILEAELGPEHEFVVKTLHELGRSLRDLQRLAEGKEHLQRALNLKERTFGCNDVSLCSTLYELGLCLRDSQRVSEAEEHLRRGLRILDTAEHENQASTRTELAKCLLDLQKFADATE